MIPHWSNFQPSWNTKTQILQMCLGTDSPEQLEDLPEFHWKLRQWSRFWGLELWSFAASDWIGTPKKGFEDQVEGKCSQSFRCMGFQMSRIGGLMEELSSANSLRRLLQRSIAAVLLEASHTPSSGQMLLRKSNFVSHQEGYNAPGSDWTTLQTSRIQEMLEVRHSPCFDWNIIRKSSSWVHVEIWPHNFPLKESANIIWRSWRIWESNETDFEVLSK